MKSKILLITIFVAVHVNHISSETLNIKLCQNDDDVVESVRQLSTKVVPILLIRDIDGNPLNKENDMKMIKRFYEEENIFNLLVVTADTCVATRSVLHGDFKERNCPSLHYFNNNRLMRKKWTSINQNTLEQSLSAARKFETQPKPHFNFDVRITESIKNVRKKREQEEREAANRIGNYGRPIKPLITQVMTQPSYPSGTVAQTTTSTQPIAMTNQLPISVRPRKNKQPFVQTGRSNPSTTFAQSPVETQSNLSRRGRLYRQTDLPQTSVSIRSTGMTQPATYVGTTVGPSTAYSPNTTWTTSAGTLVGEQPLGSVKPQTLDLFRDEPSISQPKPLETQNLLGTLGQHQEKDQNHEVGSDLPSTQLGIYFSDEGGSSKRPRMK